MQKVSQKYKESMKSALRGRGYILVTFGLVNQDAQNAAWLTGDATVFSNGNIFTSESDMPVYATLEENFSRVDDSMIFLPRAGEQDAYYNTGAVSSNLVSAGNVSFTVWTSAGAVDVKGITVDFGGNYPVDFDISADTGQTLQVRGNTAEKWHTEEVFDGISSITVTPLQMLSTNTRLRIRSFLFGYGLVYTNTQVLDSSLDSYVHPVCMDLPQYDFTVKVSNLEGYFDVDDPDSAVNFVETGQEVDVRYGYELPDGQIEWLQGTHLLCSDWESTDKDMTIRCQDLFRTMDVEYYRGTFSKNGKSYYDLAVEVLEDAGIEQYYVDARLKSLYTKLPIPRVPHKEALQLIANACRCVLYVSRKGIIQIASSFEPEVFASANGESSYSNVSAILNGTEKQEYATLSQNYTTVDGSMFFLADDNLGVLNTGYVSAAVSDAENSFAENPVVTITLEAAKKYYGCTLLFGNALPAEFILKAYNGQTAVDEVLVTVDEIQKETRVKHEFEVFDRLEIEFVKTAEPHSRVVLNGFSLGDVTDFIMGRNDMKAAPKTIKYETVKTVVVPWYSWQQTEKEEALLTENVSVKTGQELVFYLQEPSYGYRVTVDGAETGARIADSGAYYVKILFSTEGDHELKVFGYSYNVTEQTVEKPINRKGQTVTWKNPLVDRAGDASELADWLFDYYSGNIEYQYDTRGNPELDANDIIFQENAKKQDMQVRVTRSVLNFKQAFSGSVTARRMG